jgi:hypothetical protein
MTIPIDTSEPGVTFFVDRDGCIWKGPISPDDNLHFARYEGKITSGPSVGKEIWVLRRSSRDPDWDVLRVRCSEELALRPYMPWSESGMMPLVMDLQDEVFRVMRLDKAFGVPHTTPLRGGQ